MPSPPPQADLLLGATPKQVTFRGPPATPAPLASTSGGSRAPTPPWAATAASLLTWRDPPASAVALGAGVVAGLALDAVARAAAGGTLAALAARVALTDVALNSLRALLSPRSRASACWAGSDVEGVAVAALAACVARAVGARDALLNPRSPRGALAAAAALVALAHAAPFLPGWRALWGAYVAAFAVGAAWPAAAPAVGRAATAARALASAAAAPLAAVPPRARAAAALVALTACWAAAGWAARAEALLLAALFARAALLRPATETALQRAATPYLASASKQAARLSSAAGGLARRAARGERGGWGAPEPRRL